MRRFFNSNYSQEPQSQSRRRRRKEIHFPTLPPIPERSAASANECKAIYFDHGFRCQEKKDRKFTRNPQQKITACLLILAPGYILFLCLMIMHPPLHHVHRHVYPISPLGFKESNHHGQRNHGQTDHQLARISNKFSNKHADVATTELLLNGRNSQRNDASKMSKKRIVFLSIENENVGLGTPNMFSYEAMKTENLETEPQNVKDEDTDIHTNTTSSCVPMAKWQTMSFPTCNSLHEINIFSPTPIMSYFQPHRFGSRRNGRHFQPFPHKGEGFPIQNQYSSQLLGNGWFRHAFKVVDNIYGVNTAMKTLRLEREFLPEYYELHRRDAVAMERLTSSPYVMDIYGYCGQSALTELAFLEKGINNVYRVATGLKGNHSPDAMRSKLQIGAMMALGVAHVHNIAQDDDLDNNDMDHSRIGSNLPSLVHYDINPRNIVMTPSGKPKINDFNVAEFLTWDSMTHEPCGFEGRLHEPWWRAPEEMVLFPDDGKMSDEDNEGFANRVNPPKLKLNEKVDVYSLGNALFVLLEGSEPRGKDHKERRYKSVSNMVAEGVLPKFSELYVNSTDEAVVAIREGILRCWEPVPEMRPSAMEIAQNLYKALEVLKDSHQ